MTCLVLIVEDDADIREDLADVLRSEGYQTATASNGLEARGWLRSARSLPGCILLDLMMPVMDGWRFRVEQLQDARIARIPVVVLSGAGDVRQEAAALGVADYLQKPFELSALMEAVERSCSASSP
jgi:CheY-like chemotaxis protein